MISLNSTKERIKILDAVRGVAILMVILVHVSQSVPGLPALVQTVAHGGQFGVQLFFIASAFTLCASVGAERGAPIDLRRFLFRRLFRIAPLYYIGILFYLGINCLMNTLAGRGLAPSYPLPPRSSDQRVFVADVKQASGILEWTPNVSARNGIADMLKGLQDSYE